MIGGACDSGRGGDQFTMILVSLGSTVKFVTGPGGSVDGERF